jgi:hypothetical protein
VQSGGGGGGVRARACVVVEGGWRRTLEGRVGGKKGRDELICGCVGRRLRACGLTFVFVVA